jgi:hypothetical protein
VRLKTAIGIVAFILLGLCTYTAASADYHSSFQSNKVVSEVGSQDLILGPDLDPTAVAARDHVEYRAPIIDAGENTPLIVTGVLESFVLLCWMLLRKIEPKMNALAVDLVETIKENHQESQ